MIYRTLKDILKDNDGYLFSFFKIDCTKSYGNSKKWWGIENKKVRGDERGFMLEGYCIDASPISRNIRIVFGGGDLDTLEYLKSYSDKARMEIL